MNKTFMNEVAKMDAEKIVNEKMQNFWTAILCICILFMCAVAGFAFGEGVGEREGRKEIVQELCAKQQYDFCTVEKVIYNLKKQSEQ